MTNVKQVGTIWPGAEKVTRFEVTGTDCDENGDNSGMFQSFIAANDEHVAIDRAKLARYKANRSSVTVTGCREFE